MSVSLQINTDTIIDQRFRLIERIGVGGMSEVWRAEHLRLPASFAIKFLYRHQMDQETLKRFEREAHIMATLSHPHITRINDFNVLSDGTPYIVLEYLEGEPLSDRLLRGALDLLSVQEVVTQVGSALNITHARGIVHRDLKPDNIFLCHHDEEHTIHAKVLDFGVSKITSHQNLQMTQDQRGFLGTPHYMSPEQALGSHQIDARADQFALAIICYEMLVGHKPFNGNSIFEIASQVINHTPAPVHHYQPRLSSNVSECLLKALSKDPQNRYADCRLFVQKFCQSLNLNSSDDFDANNHTEISDTAEHYNHHMIDHGHTNHDHENGLHTIPIQMPDFSDPMYHTQASGPPTQVTNAPVTTHVQNENVIPNQPAYRVSDDQLTAYQKFDALLNTPPPVLNHESTADLKDYQVNEYMSSAYNTPHGQYAPAQSFPNLSGEYEALSNSSHINQLKKTKRMWLIFGGVMALLFILFGIYWLTLETQIARMKEQAVQMNAQSEPAEIQKNKQSIYQINKATVMSESHYKKAKKRFERKRMKKFRFKPNQKKVKDGESLTLVVEFESMISKDKTLKTYWVGGPNNTDRFQNLKPISKSYSHSTTKTWQATYKNIEAGHWVVYVLDDAQSNTANQRVNSDGWSLRYPLWLKQ